MGVLYDVPYFSSVPSIADLQARGLFAFTGSGSGYLAYQLYWGASVDNVKLVSFMYDHNYYNGYLMGSNSPFDIYETDIRYNPIRLTIWNAVYDSNIGLYSVHRGATKYESNNVLIQYDSENSAIVALRNAFSSSYPISYRLTNCSAPSAPMEAVVGDTVNVDFIFPEGYGIVNSASDVYVTNNGVIIPSSYANGRLTFTMSDPS